MLIPRVVAVLLLVSLMIPGTGAVYSQDFPNKPIRIVTGSVGGVGDVTARLIARNLTDTLGQPVITDNRPGSLPDEIVSKSPPDGYTLLSDGGSFFIAPLLQPMPYDVIRDFSPISQTTLFIYVLVVPASVPANSVKELIALAKAKPGVLNYAQFGTGGSSHLSAELFKSMAGINVVNIPYKGSAAAVVGLLGGEAQLCFCVPDSALPQVKQNKLRALAITSAQPSALFPDLPTMAASGLPGYESVGTQGVFAPAKTPRALINRLNQELVRILNRADVKERLMASGLEAKSSSPEAFEAYIKSEQAKWGKVIKDAGIKGG